MSGPDRAAIRTAQLVWPKAGVEAKLYQDATNDSAIRAGATLGLIGGLIAAGVVQSNTGAGLNRWAPVLSGRNAEVLARVERGVQQHFQESAGLRLTPAGPADGQFEFLVIQYGVRHAGAQEFNVVTFAQVQIKRPNGEVAWRSIGTGKSILKRTLAAYQGDPQTFLAAVDESATALAKSLVQRF